MSGAGGAVSTRKNIVSTSLATDFILQGGTRVVQTLALLSRAMWGARPGIHSLRCRNWTGLTWSTSIPLTLVKKSGRTLVSTKGSGNSPEFGRCLYTSFQPAQHVSYARTRLHLAGSSCWQRETVCGVGGRFHQRGRPLTRSKGTAACGSANGASVLRLSSSTIKAHGGPLDHGQGLCGPWTSKARAM